MAICDAIKSISQCNGEICRRGEALRRNHSCVGVVIGAYLLEMTLLGESRFFELPWRGKLAKVTRKLHEIPFVVNNFP